jgi:hypothetical protein
MGTISVSGTIRVNDGSATVFTKTFSAAVTVSQFITRDIILANGVSDVIVSVAEMSNPGFMMLLGGTSALRVNFGNHASADSAASLGFEFNNLYAQIGSGTSGSINLHIANSSGDSSVVTLVQGQ